MANKLYAMEQLTEEVARDIAAKPEEWMRFLDTASRLYKYTFDEQPSDRKQRQWHPWRYGISGCTDGSRKGQKELP